jgi:tetratricopeptide (TPR) repeat protein
MAQATELLAAGQRWQQAGDLSRAEEAYRQLLEQEPGHAQAWYLLGSVCLVRGELATAAASLEQALRLRPAFAEALHYRGIVFAQQGRLPEAAARFHEALRLAPGDLEIQTNLGLALSRQGQYVEAVALLQAVLRSQPGHARAQGQLREARALQAATEGMTCLDQGNLAEAEAHFRRALQIWPEFPEGHNNLGHTLSRQRRLEEAVACYREALRLRPDFGGAYNNLGLALREQKRTCEAEASFRAAVQFRPQLAEAHNNLGLTLLDQNRLDEAIASLRRAIEVQPGFAEAHNNLGNALLHLGRLEDALASYANAVRARPDYAEAHWNATIVRLQRGEFQRGLAEFERRCQMPGSPCHRFTQPRWDGSPLTGRTILLYAEQGLGDTILFVRYARLVKERGATVIVACQRPLLPLLACCPGIDQLVAQDDPLPPHDVCAPLLSLPHLFRTTVETIPAPVPYLSADPELVEQWRRKLAALPGLKIGINWQGNPQYQHDRRRSFPLLEFAPLAAVPGVQLVSLQHGSASAQLDAVREQWPVADLGGRLDEEAGPFMDRAAVMKNLDLVITSDTSIPHLAGALGAPVWLALGKVSYWCYLLEREDCPWYPSMRLFRQEHCGEWGPVFQRIARAVQQLRSSERRSGS